MACALPPSSGTKHSGPGRPKDLGKRVAILNAARSLFFEQGFSRVSMDGIAALAGVSKLTVYSHFGDKETLFTEAVRAQCQQLMPDDLFAHERHGPLRQQLLEIGAAFFAMISSEDAIATHRMMLSPGTGDDHVRKMFWEAGPQRTQQAFASFLSSRVRSGELAIDDLALASTQFFHILKGELLIRMMCGLERTPSDQEVQRHLQASIDLFLRAYARR